ncbi:hypothetical protein S245_034567 [Arachis hypogaea]
MREEEVASVAAKPSLAGLGSPSPLSCVPPLVSGSPLCFCCNSPLSWPAWKEACATLQKLLSAQNRTSPSLALPLLPILCW